MEKVVIKIGSQAILSQTGEVREDILQNIIKQITQLQSQGVKIILVSSGAVALGRSAARKIAGTVYGQTIADKQLLASFGQPRLMAVYSKICEQSGVMAAQLLLTKYDFQTKRSYSNILRLLEKSLSQPNVLTIINENDSVAIEELMFTDNDELSGIIAAQIGADKLILLTSVDGVYDTNPTDPSAKLLREISLKDSSPKLDSDKTSMGRGGMQSKLSTARKMAAVGVMTHIANAHENNVILRLILSTDNKPGSTVLPNNKKSALKRYLAFSGNIVTASITVNDCLVKVLADENNCVSILPVGIESHKGEFKKDDIIDILTGRGEKIGIGIARYNSQKLKEYTGGKNHPAFIHYNYLYIDHSKFK